MKFFSDGKYLENSLFQGIEYDMCRMMAGGERVRMVAHLNDEYAYIYTKRARIRTFICAHLLLHIVYRAPHSGYKTNKIKQTPTGSIDVSYLMSGLIGREAVLGG